METIQLKEALKVVEERFSRKLEKVRIYPEFIHSCEPLFRQRSLLRSLKKLGVEELHLVKEKADNLKHPIDHKYLPLYRYLCQNFRLDTFSTREYNYADTGIRKGSNTIAIPLGERKPFVPRNGRQVEMGISELKDVVSLINSYINSLKGLLIASEISLPPWAESGTFSDSSMVNADHYDVVSFSDYCYLNIPKPKEAVKQEMEREKKRKELIQKLDEILKTETVVSEEEQHRLYKVRPETVYKILKEEAAAKVIEVASEIYVLNTPCCVFTSSPTVTMPLNLLQASKYLENLLHLGVLTRRTHLCYQDWCKLIWSKIKGPLLVAKDLYYEGSRHFILIKPKPLRKLPPIPKAEVVITPMRLILVNEG